MTANKDMLDRLEGVKTQNYSLGQVGDYEIKQLKIFKAVVDCGGFAAAESYLNVGRPTISIHISNLEARLNLVLCKRGRAGFSLTEEGEVIYRMANELFEFLDNFRGTVNSLNSQCTGQLRIALSDRVCLDPQSRFPELIKQYSAYAPNVSLVTQVSSMANIERIILNDEADIGFIPYHRPLEGLNYQHIYSDACYVYVAKGHPLTSMSEEEQTIKVDEFPASHSGVKLHDDLNEQVKNMKLAAVSYFYDVRLSLILSGQYIGFLPERYAEDYEKLGLIQAVAKTQRTYTLGVAVAYRKTMQLNKPTELFLQALQKVFDINELSSAPY